MKYLLIALVLIAQPVLATQPAYLKDATITVTLTNGKTYTYSANEYMVVKRGQAKAATQTQTAAPTYSPEKEQPYRITLHGGVGFEGQDVTQAPNQVNVEERKAFVFGASLSRKVSDKVSVGATALSNETFLFGLGFDFK
jgi:hypothetical protein